MAAQPSLSEAVLALPYVPASINRLTGGNGWTWRRAKADLQRDIETLLLAERLPRPARFVGASANLTFTTRRRRDEDNYRPLLSKCLADGLVNGGWLPDDVPEYFRFGGLSFSFGCMPRTTIVIAWEPA